MPKALVLLVHDLGDHCQRNMNMVQNFLGLGFAVYGLDHVGHGFRDWRHRHHAIRWKHKRCLPSFR